MSSIKKADVKKDAIRVGNAFFQAAKSKGTGIINFCREVGIPCSRVYNWRNGLNGLSLRSEVYLTNGLGLTAETDFKPVLCGNRKVLILTRQGKNRLLDMYFPKTNAEPATEQTGISVVAPSLAAVEQEPLKAIKKVKAVKVHTNMPMQVIADIVALATNKDVADRIIRICDHLPPGVHLGGILRLSRD